MIFCYLVSFPSSGLVLLVHLEHYQIVYRTTSSKTSIRLTMTCGPEGNRVCDQREIYIFLYYFHCELHHLLSFPISPARRCTHSLSTTLLLVPEHSFSASLTIARLRVLLFSKHKRSFEDLYPYNRVHLASSFTTIHYTIPYQNRILGLFRNGRL